MKIKNNTTVLLIAFFLASCTSTTTPIPPVKIAIPTATLMPITLTPTITSTSTITPTPLPPTPEGAQSFDQARNLATKIDNGTTYYYIPEISGWVTALNQNPIWLVDKNNSAGDIADGLPNNYKSMKVYYYRLPGAAETFYSVEEPSEYASGISGNSRFSVEPNMFHTTQDYVAMLLAERFNKVEETDLTAHMLKDVLNQIADNSLVLAIDIPVIAKDNSNVTTKYWDPNKNIDFIQIPWESTNNDPSFFGRLAYTYRWKLDVRGGQEESNPGNLVVIYATSYSHRLHDWEEADIHLLGPIHAALKSQQMPQLDYVTFGAADLNNFTGEFYTLYKPKGLGKEEEKKIWESFQYYEMEAFAHSASISSFFSAPFLEYKCVFYEKSGAQTIIYCYAPSEYLIKKSKEK